MVKIGVLALQGDFLDHKKILEQLDVDVIEVRTPDDLAGIHGLIIPGGESTTIGKLLVKYDLLDKITALGKAGLPIYGTCAGAILLATEIKGSEQPRLGLLDMTIERNGYGRQIDSFEADVIVKDIGAVHGIFIRAPVIEKCEGTVLAQYEGNPVFVMHKNLMVTTFHPEMTDDVRVHKYFLDLVYKQKQKSL